MKKLILAAGLTATTLFSTLAATTATAADYVIDTQGAHAFVQFKIKHLGYSWLLGRFNTFEGGFNYDAKAPEKSDIALKIDVASIDSNHAERDKHLRGKGFLEVNKYPTATFKSTKFTPSSDETDGHYAVVEGIFTLHGVTKNISFPVQKVGEGEDPWGGYRVGFEGKTTLKLTDYGIDYDLGPASTHVELGLYVEGIRQ